MQKPTTPVARQRKKPSSVQSLTKLGRERLSRHFFMRDFLNSEISNFYQIPNIPDDPALALTAGRALAIELLDPLVDTFGPIAVRSAYRSPAVNDFGNKNGIGCASNERNRAGHIWDQRDAEGRMGATVSVPIPWFADQYARGRDWQDLAWWLYEHLNFHSIFFFPKLAAFNLTWREEPEKRISSWIGPKRKILAPDQKPEKSLEERRRKYDDFPAYRGINYPKTPNEWLEF
jgi:hypothetical protein